MDKKISVIGGDLKNIKLVEMLVEDGFDVLAFAIEDADSLKNEKIKHCALIEEAISEASIIIGPMPLSINGVSINTTFSDQTINISDLFKSIEGKTLIAGDVRDDILLLAKEYNVTIIDLFKREEFSVLNTISTAEGAIQMAMEQTTRTIHGSKVLVLGYGRIGKLLTKMLLGLGANVSCEARKNADLAWIKAYGYIPIHLDNLNEKLGSFDLIINTIPFKVLNETNLDKVKKDCLIIDIATNPGGIDRNTARKMKVNVVWALSLPGKVAPTTSAEFIKETVYNILSEI